jgi:hypothetical protein
MNLPAVKSLVSRGCIFQCMAHLSRLADYSSEDRLIIYTKPTRKVEASRPANIGEVILLPETNSVKTIARAEIAEPPANTVEVQFEPADPDHHYYLMPCNGLECVAPLWSVGTTEEKEEANMAWSTVKVQSLQGHDFYGPLKPSARASVRAGASGVGRAAGQSEASGQSEAPGNAVAPGLGGASGQGEASGQGVGPEKQKGKEKAGGKAKAKPKAKGKSKDPEPSAEETALVDIEGDICDEGTLSIVAIPVLVNCRPLRQGDELRVYKPKNDKKKAKEVLPINMAALAKKARTKE